MQKGILAQFKRETVIGSTWHAVNHAFQPPRDFGVREVSTKQTNAIAFKTEKGESWLTYPSAKDISFKDGTYEIYESGKLILTYKKM